MDKLQITGGVKLSGEVQISCAKNAYLPILAATLLATEKVRLRNLPKLRDIRTMLTLLTHLGVKISEDGQWTELDARDISGNQADYDLVKTMRASIFVLGPLLARLGEATVSLPGGCAIGSRPIDLHLDNLKKLGAEFKQEKGYVFGSAPNGLQGRKIVLSFPSVGATENLMMAAALAQGETLIENAAREPEVTDLGNFLNSLGAKIDGHGGPIIKIKGVSKLGGGEYEAIGDRIEAGTYVMAALATQSEINIKGINPQHLDFVLEKLKDMGAKLETLSDSIRVYPSKLKGTKIDTAPFPGFPTDLQAQMMALCTTCEGNSIIVEHIFENRFMHVPELRRMNAQIELEGNTALIQSGVGLNGAPVMCTDLRASAALVIAALTAQGESEVQRIYHLERGYEDLDRKLTTLGAKIERAKA